MSQAALLELFDQYSDEILHRQDESWQAPTPEAFHQLRVHIKRIRALLGLVEELSGSSKVAERRRVFRKVFKSAGNVRDLHVQIDLIRGVEDKRSCDVGWYRSKLEQSERDAVESFICRHDAMLEPGDIARVRKTVDKVLSKQTWVELTAKAWQHFDNRVHNTIAFDVESKDLHDLRKRTKEASNLTWILERAFPEVELDKALKDLLDDLQNQLGKWHDFEVAVVWAEKVSGEAVPDEMRGDWERFVHALRHRRGILRAKVMRRWTTLVELRGTARIPTGAHQNASSS